MSIYIFIVPIKTINLGDELLVYYNYKRPYSRHKAQSLELGGDYNVIIRPQPKMKNKNKNKYIIDEYE